jgi:hypothetical protein
LRECLKGTPGIWSMCKDELLKLYAKKNESSENKKEENKEAIKSSDEIKKYTETKNSYNISVVSVKVSYLRTIGYNSMKQWIESSADHVYCGRPGRVWITHPDKTKELYLYSGSIFANPYKSGDFKDVSECLTAYQNHVLSSPEILKQLPSLKGKTISCFCDVNAPCHTKVLISLLNELFKEKDNN